MLELGALLLMVNAVARDGRSHSKRLLAFCDSQVSVGASTKGSSSAKALASRLKRLCALLLAADLPLGLRYIRSKGNPADGPSRQHKRPRSTGE